MAHMDDPAPAPATGAPAPETTSLAALAAHIARALPAALELGLQQDLAAGVLRDQCAELAARVQLAHADAALERAKHAALRARLARLRREGPGCQEGPAPAGVASCGTDETGGEADKENAANLSLVSDGSPISLRSKRKGRVFPDDMRIVKRMRLSLE